MVRTKEQIREYHKKWYQKNREKQILWARKWRKDNPKEEKKRKKKYYEENREKIIQKRKKYYEENKEKVIESKKKYRKENPERYHKSYIISSWKQQGLIVDDPDEFESIYYLVMSTENCELCNCKLTENNPRTATSRCLDHDHFTGKFRAVLCIRCNSSQPKQPKQIKNNINIDEII